MLGERLKELTDDGDSKQEPAESNVAADFRPTHLRPRDLTEVFRDSRVKVHHLDQRVSRRLRQARLSLSRTDGVAGRVEGITAARQSARDMAYQVQSALARNDQ